MVNHHDGQWLLMVDHADEYAGWSATVAYTDQLYRDGWVSCLVVSTHSKNMPVKLIRPSGGKNHYQNKSPSRLHRSRFQQIILKVCQLNSWLQTSTVAWLRFPVPDRSYWINWMLTWYSGNCSDKKLLSTRLWSTIIKPTLPDINHMTAYSSWLTTIKKWFGHVWPGLARAESSSLNRCQRFSASGYESAQLNAMLKSPINSWGPSILEWSSFRPLWIEKRTTCRHVRCGWCWRSSVAPI